jgi:hypothetical protein
MKPPDSVQETVAEPVAFWDRSSGIDAALRGSFHAAPGVKDTFIARRLSDGGAGVETKRSELKSYCVKTRLPAMHRFLRISSVIGC